jgi:uncharacterized protein (DUF1330 family)
MMKVIDPTPESFSALGKDVPANTPIVMLNLLRFKTQAEYPADSEFVPCTGREAYARYAKHAATALVAAGAEVIWAGHALSHPIVPPGEQWDNILLVRYPDIDAFLTMVMAESYQRETVHRTAALDDSRLVCMQQDS